LPVPVCPYAKIVPENDEKNQSLLESTGTEQYLFKKFL
jgi:hypothetical protein